MNTNQYRFTPKESTNVMFPWKLPLYKGSKRVYNSEKIKIPIMIPTTLNMASILPIATADKLVHGQKPPATNPIPMIAPPIMAPHRYVG